MENINFPTDHNSSGEIFQEALADLDDITNRSIAEIDDIADTSSDLTGDESDPEIELNINRLNPEDRIDPIPPPSPPPPLPPLPIFVPIPDIEMADALRDAIHDAFQGVQRASNYPMPLFSGKKGEKPEDHVLRVEDYFEHFNIENENKCREFKKTLTGKARAWASTIANRLPPLAPAADPADRARPWEADGPNPARARIEESMKNLFLTRFATQGRTPEALYAEWQNLKFDPQKDDIEDFMRDVKKIADGLGYGDGAVLMAVKGALPIEIQNLTITIDDIDQLRTFLIKVFDNPRMRATYGGTKESPGTSSGAFAAATAVAEPYDPGMTSLWNKLNSIESKFNKFSVSDTRHPNARQYKPQVTPKRGRGHGQGQNRGRSQDDQNFNRTDYRPNRSYNNDGRNRGNQTRGNNRGNYTPRGRGRSYDKSPNVNRPRIASRTPNKDSGRCFYCKELGHFIRRCQKKAEDERRQNYREMHEVQDQDEDFPAQLDVIQEEDYLESESNVFNILNS